MPLFKTDVDPKAYKNPLVWGVLIYTKVVFGKLILDFMQSNRWDP